jgi:CBS domain-containing protein
MPLTKPVSAIMTTNTIIANASHKISQVLRLFIDYPIHHLPIVDADNKLIGIVSSNDIPKVFEQLCGRADKITMDYEAIDNALNLTAIMTPNPITISSTDTIEAAVKIFTEKKFLALPVVDNGELVGILSAKDVIYYISSDRHGISYEFVV